MTTTRAGRTATTSSWNSPNSFNSHVSNLYKELFRLSTLAAHRKTIKYTRLWLEYEEWVQNCLFGFHSFCSSEYLQNSLLSLQRYTRFCSAHGFRSETDLYCHSQNIYQLWWKCLDLDRSYEESKRAVQNNLSAAKRSLIFVTLHDALQ